jgi:hypothetical protein
MVIPFVASTTGDVMKTDTASPITIGKQSVIPVNQNSAFTSAMSGDQQ